MEDFASTSHHMKALSTVRFTAMSWLMDRRNFVANILRLSTLVSDSPLDGFCAQLAKFEYLILLMDAPPKIPWLEYWLICGAGCVFIGAGLCIPKAVGQSCWMIACGLLILGNVVSQILLARMWTSHPDWCRESGLKEPALGAAWNLESFRCALCVLRKNARLRQNRINGALVWLALGCWALSVLLIVSGPLIPAAEFVWHALTHEKPGTW